MGTEASAPPREGSADDRIEGGGATGNDILRGGAGNDLIVGGADKDAQCCGEAGDVLYWGKYLDIEAWLANPMSADAAAMVEKYANGAAPDNQDVSYPRGGLGGNTLYETKGGQRLLPGGREPDSQWQ